MKKYTVYTSFPNGDYMWDPKSFDTLIEANRYFEEKKKHAYFMNMYYGGKLIRSYNAFKK